ncbi:uncharacterized protein LOC106642136 [Copidosoma floridanum]|uniref:uncharacterized protein LOC106642136 n=1 Tax=Copidosoma floridanum TaxID=29053 RepID=UPI0006C9BCC8|nr:uncharacterized protein LOC106642136 [Copidosoma floridanum]
MTVIKRISIPIVKKIVHVIVLLSFLQSVTAITASIRSEVEGEGFHRTLKYHVDTGTFMNDSCYVAVFVQLPPFLYVNADELADLRRLDKIMACSEGEIDVELFAEKAHYQNLTVCSKLSSTKTTLSVPIHQRYRFSTDTGQPIHVSIPRPLLFIGCKDRIKEHRVSKIRIGWPCIDLVKKWRDVFYVWEGDRGFVWKIPAGNTSRKYVVTGVTMLVTLLGGAYVLWSIHKSFKVPSEKKIKDS